MVGVSSFAPKKPEKPIVSGFSRGNIENIIRVDPELVITFSDVQAGLAEDLIRAGVPVLALNHFTVAGVADSVRLLGRVLGRVARDLVCDGVEGEGLLGLEQHQDEVRDALEPIELRGRIHRREPTAVAAC